MVGEHALRLECRLRPQRADQRDQGELLGRTRLWEGAAVVGVVCARVQLTRQSGTRRRGVAWRCVVWWGGMRRGVVNVVRLDVAWNVVVMCGVAWSGTPRPDVLRRGVWRRGLAWRSAQCRGVAWHAVA